MNGRISELSVFNSFDYLHFMSVFFIILFGELLDIRYNRSVAYW